MAAANLENLREIVQKLLRRKAFGSLDKVLTRTHPADIAALFRFFGSRDRRRIFELIEDRDRRAELVSEVDDSIASEIAALLDDTELGELLTRMSPDDAADLIGLLDEGRAHELLQRMKEEEVEGLLRYDEETAGGIMVPDFFALPEETTAAEAIRHLQTAADIEMAFYVYVINEHGHLVGVVSLRQLVICAPKTRLSDLMEPDAIRVRPSVDREEVAKMVARYNILAVPVVNEANKLLGIVTVDDVIDVIREEATEDILKMGGAGHEDLLELPAVRRSVRVRMPWLLASFVGGVVAAFIIGTFEQELQRVAALAAFIPIVMGMGGNVGTQSSTIIVRGLATGHIDVARLGSTVGREIMVGLLLGSTYGVLLALVAALLYHDSGVSVAGLGATVGLSICAAMATAAMFGAGIPLVFERINIDPAIATGPFVTTAVDIFGILIYFGMAQLLIPELGLPAG